MRSIRSRTTPGTLMMVGGFLIAGLAAACSQEQGPTEPDDEFATPLLTHKNDKPHGKPGDGDAGTEVGTFQMTFSGAISGTVGEFQMDVKGGTTRVGDNFNTDPLTFSQDLIDALDPTPYGCFANNPFTGPVTISERKKDGRAGTQFWFDAIGTDGTDPEPHQLKMRGDFDGGPWPPEVGGSNTITGDSLFIESNANAPKCRGALGGAGLYTILVERLN